MRKGFFIIFLFLSSSLGAEKFGLFVTGGYSFPGSPMDFVGYWDAGFNFGGGLIFSPTSTFSIRGNFDYTEFELKEEKYRIDHSQEIPHGVILQGGSTQIMYGAIGLKASPLMPIPFRPYFTGEIGGIRKIWNEISYMWGGQQETVVPGDYETVPSIVVFGLGIDFSYTTIDVFIEGGYRVAFTTVKGWTGYAPLKIGITLKF